MKRSLLLLAPLLLVALPAALLLSQDDLPKGKYRKEAKPSVIDGWMRDFADKRELVPAPPPPPPSTSPATDFSGTYRFGKYDYDLVIGQEGDQVTFRSGGVDHQDIGGAFDTFGAGEVAEGRIRARWWCVDITRNVANNGGCEMWFHEGDRNLIYARYYHDADEAIEEGYGVRVGTHAGKELHYRIRVAKRTEELPAGTVIRGRVRDRDGAVLRDAVVMLRHDEASAVRTDDGGRFAIPVKEMPYVLMVAAAAPGYRTRVKALLLHELRDLDFVLEAAPSEDDARYVFLDPTPDKGRDLWRCGNCHRNSYAEWKASRHALAATSAVTRAVYEKDFLPALEEGRARGDEGLCTACHAPQAALDGATARLDRVTGIAAHGNHCDFCHKVHHTEEIEAAGVRGSLALGRPAPDDPRVPGPVKRVYGPLADADYGFMGAVYSPFFATGALCAGCHQYTTQEGLAALDTYGEWRRWAGARRRHESCQTCHMPEGTSMEGKKLARRICVNALRRPPEQIHDHGFLGRDLAPTALGLHAEGARTDEGVVVDVTLQANSVGHKVPTGSGDKHLLLVLVATDAAGRPLPLRAGRRVPEHAGGEGDPLALPSEAFAARVEAHDFAGMAGREFAQVLVDAEGHAHVPFWRAVRQAEDTRLEPDVPVAERFRFSAAAGATVRIEVWHRLRYKRDDVAAGVEGAGVRPLDQLVATTTVEIP